MCKTDIPVIANDDHAKNGTGAADSSEEAIDVAPELAPHPVALGEPVDNHRQAHRRHHHQVGDGQVHHEYVAWRSQSGCLRARYYLKLLLNGPSYMMQSFLP